MFQKRNEGIESLTMIPMHRASVVLGLVVLISVSASFPHGSGHQDTGHAHYGDKFKKPNANSDVLCSRLRRYIDTMLNCAAHCNGTADQEAGNCEKGKCKQFLFLNSGEKESEEESEEVGDLESCLSSPPSFTTIKECVENHNETSEAVECVTNFLEVSC